MESGQGSRPATRQRLRDVARALLAVRCSEMETSCWSLSSLYLCNSSKSSTHKHTQSHWDKCRCSHTSTPGLNHLPSCVPLLAWGMQSGQWRWNRCWKAITMQNGFLQIETFLEWSKTKFSVIYFCFLSILHFDLDLDFRYFNSIESKIYLYFSKFRQPKVKGMLFTFLTWSDLKCMSLWIKVFPQWIKTTGKRVKTKCCTRVLLVC